MDEVGIYSRLSETEFTTLTEALCSQQQLLQKLYAELDEERASSATAASEALSMMLRLQGEKAAVKMEASHYKRIAEEKMCHAEESLAVFEDVMYQKEMEIAALEFQVQAYRYKLLSMGCNDLDVVERFRENTLVQRYEACVGDMGVHGIVRKSNSLPPLSRKDSSHMKSVIKRERSVSVEADLIPMIVEENTDKESYVHSIDLEKMSESSAVGNFDSYWEQIRKLDEKVKEILDYKDHAKGNFAYLKSRSSSCSLHSQASVGTSCLPASEHSENLVETEATVNYSCSSSVHDIFEVPMINKNHEDCPWQKKQQGKLILEDENRLGKPDLVLPKAAESFVGDAIGREKKMLHCANNEKKLLKPRDAVEVDCRLSLVHATTNVAECQAEIHQLSRRMKQIENERRTIRQEIRGGEEESNLLKELREQLDSIQSEIRSWKTKKKSPVPDEFSLNSLSEAMLYFWL